MNYNCSIFWDLRNLQEQVKKAFCYQKLFWPFTVWINCSSDLKNFENSRLSASNFKSFSRSLEQFFLTVGQNNFGNKIPLLNMYPIYYSSTTTSTEDEDEPVRGKRNSKGGKVPKSVEPSKPHRKNIFPIFEIFS